MIFDFFKRKNKENNKQDTAAASEKAKILTKNEILDRILNGEFSSFIELKSETRDDIIYIPELEMKIKPYVWEVKERIVNISFDMYSDVLKTRFFEICAGLGEDSESAYGMAIGSFAFSFMQGLKAVADNDVKCRITSEFAGHSHSWSVYSSDIVRAGASKEKHEVSDYWELLKDDIIKRLGNQKTVYVKVFNSGFGSKVIGECRINDIVIPELGAKVAEIAKKWETSQYKSEKQFFFIVRDDVTRIDYPYDGVEGEKKIHSAVTEYLDMVMKMDSREDYDSIVENLSAVTGDKTLAFECFCYIPEMCAERYFDEAFIFGDMINFVFHDESTVASYKCQLSDYIRIRDSFFDIFNSGVLGNELKNVYARLIGMSLLLDSYEKLEGKMEKTKRMKVDFINYNVPEDFEVR